jgi:hypothetical protein
MRLSRAIVATAVALTPLGAFAGTGDVYKCGVADFQVQGTLMSGDAISQNMKRTYEIRQLDGSFRVIAIAGGQFTASDDYIFLSGGNGASYAVAPPLSHIATFVIDERRDASAVDIFGASITRHALGQVQTWFLSCTK